MAFRFRRVLISGAVITLAIAFIAPASALGRCGGALAIDSPTTLQKVARQCQVSVAALREANPGLRPENIRPGAYVAIPTKPPHSENTSGGSTVGERPQSQSLRELPAGLRIGPRLNARYDANRRQESARESGRSNGQGANSFQRRAALRMHSLTRPVLKRLDKLNSNNRPRIIMRLPPTPVATQSPQELLEPKSKVVASVGRSYQLPDYSAINPAAQRLSSQRSVTGRILGQTDSCLLMATSDGAYWSLAAVPDAERLIGKVATVWGAPSERAACGDGPALLVSHVVFAEPEDGW